MNRSFFTDFQCTKNRRTFKDLRWIAHFSQTFKAVKMAGHFAQAFKDLRQIAHFSQTFMALKMADHSAQTFKDLQELWEVSLGSRPPYLPSSFSISSV